MYRKAPGLVVTSFVAATAAAALTLSAGAAHANPLGSLDLDPPADPVETPFCSIEYPDPNQFDRTDTSDVTVSSQEGGLVRFTFHTRSQTTAPYTQAASVTWANLDSGISGVGDTSARVGAGETTLTVPVQETGPGRITAVARVTNTADNGQDVTTLDCSSEYTVP
ncbi:hypothetical protein EV641_104247 [Rhodococcus sp. SMB37]|uniref:hypothetical protein n=1 Tax=Rhodococcus sp. SMB37 TaxID=2512213 RepID=UPI0006CF79ED|nr:hypothetical protein [Rhodococcus sp. SMB37]TCN54982.1 hypothetical protein EV641_104247 [Rhodococcus sp. SMB37]